MTFNPCGRLVDFLGESVIDYIRPFRDNPLVVRRRWYPVPDDTPPLGFPTRYGTLHYKAFKWAASFVGPVYPIEFERIKTGTPPGLTYDHICGSPDDFLNGAVFDPAADVVYDDEWIPLCCGRASVCVTQLCAEVPVNGVSAAQLWSYPLPHQDADAATPVWLFQRAFNQGNTVPPSPGIVEAWYPSGSAQPAAYSAEMVANSSGVPQFREVTFRRAVDEAVTERVDANGWTMTVEQGGVSGTLTAKIVGGQLEFCGTNAVICAALLPSTVYQRSQQTIIPAGTTILTAAPITATNVKIDTTSSGQGMILPAQTGAVVWIQYGFPNTGSFKLYPPIGERINGGTINSPINITPPTTGSGLWVAIRQDSIGTGFPGFWWTVVPVDEEAFTGTVTSVDIATTSAGMTVGGGPITGAGTLTVNLDADLNALAGLSGTNTIYYRSGAGTWSPVAIGANLTFSGGTLAGAAPGTGTVTSVSVGTSGVGLSSAGSPITTSGSITLTLSTSLQDLHAFPVLDAIPCGNGSGTWQTLGFGSFLSYAAGVISCTPPTASSGQSVTGGFTITAAAATPQATGLTVTLPAAGTYLITAQVRADLQPSVAGTAQIVAMLRDNTAAAIIANSETMVVSNAVATVLAQATATISAVVTVASGRVIELYAQRNGTAWTTSVIGSNANGRTKLNYVRLS